MIETILLLILIGLSYIGAVQAYRFIRRHYERIVNRWRQIRTVLNYIDNGKVTIAVKPKAPKAEPEVIESVPMELSTQTEPQPEPQPDEMPQDETLLITIDIEDGEGEYSLSEAVDGDELEHLSRTLSVKTAPIADEITAAGTIVKLKDSPLLDAFLGVTGNRVKDMFSNVAGQAPQVAKEGFNYSKFITK